jgi:hypothetical protein
MTVPLRILEGYILSSIVLDCVKDVMQYYNIRTLWLSQCYNLVELLLFIIIFYQWRSSKRNGMLVLSSYILYITVWIMAKFTFEPLTYSDNYTYTFSQIIQIGFGGWLMLGILQEKIINWKTDPRIWILSGIVLYAAATLFLFGMFNVMLTLPRQMMLLIWFANLIFLIIQYCFFLCAFLCNPVKSGIISQS